MAICSIKMYEQSHNYAHLMIAIDLLVIGHTSFERKLDFVMVVD